MVVLYLIGAALAGSTLGALMVLIWPAQNPLTLKGLENPVSEFKRPVKSIPQALWRLAWAVGFMILQTLLWGFSILVFLIGAVGSILAAVIGGIAGFAFLLAAFVAILSNILSNAAPFTDPELITVIWLGLYMLVFAAAYGLSARVGRDLVGKKEKE